MSFLVLALRISTGSRAYAAVSQSAMRNIDKVNKDGPYLGIVVPNTFEMNPLLQSPSFEADQKLPYLDFSGMQSRSFFILHYTLCRNLSIYVKNLTRISHLKTYIWFLSYNLF